MADKPREYPNDMKLLLTGLRGELNRLNSMNCVVHRYQSDFSINQALANTRTAAATDLYLAHLRERVTPLFVELGKMLISQGEVPPLDWHSDADDATLASLARRWYQSLYMTGTMW